MGFIENDDGWSHPKWPGQPSIFYVEWETWPDFLGTK